ncbi:MAG: sulfotransferase [Pseudomonadota bacterium]
MNALLKKLKTRTYRYQFLVPPLPRRFQAFATGTSKSGTSSLNALFSGYYRSQHEADHEELIGAALDHESGAMTDADLARLLKDRDRRLYLEMDSSLINGVVIEHIVNAFPRARFILTMRDCYSWLDSYTNHLVNHSSDDAWRRLRQRPSLGCSDAYDPREEVLKTQGIPSVAHSLRLWNTHNRGVLNSVPKDRLLVVRTHELSSSLDVICDFLNISPASLVSGKAHSFKRKSSAGLVSSIDPEFVEEMVNLYCRDLMDEFFPEFALRPSQESTSPSTLAG